MLAKFALLIYEGQLPGNAKCRALDPHRSGPDTVTMSRKSSAQHTSRKAEKRPLTPPLVKYRGGSVRPLDSTSTTCCVPKEGACFRIAFTSERGIGCTAYSVRSVHEHAFSALLHDKWSLSAG